MHVFNYSKIQNENLPTLIWVNIICESSEMQISLHRLEGLQIKTK